MLRLTHVSKSFAGRPALVDVSLHVPRGAMFALLGPNGAGKSTIFALVLGHLRASAGTVEVRGVPVGRDPVAALQGVGVVLDPPAFYDYLTGRENLLQYAAYSGGVSAPALAGAVSALGLDDRIDDRVATYSQGMRQRLALAQALLPEPELILLDEPTEGLDPEGIHNLRALLGRLHRERGITIVIATHRLSEIEALCDHVAILREGRVALAGRVADLIGDARRVRIAVDDWRRAAGVAQAIGAAVIEAGVLQLGAGTTSADLVAALVGAGIRVESVEPCRPSLTALYLATVADDRRRDASAA